MSDPTTATPTPARRWRRRALVVLLTLIVVPVAAGLIVLHSSTATRYVLQSIATGVDGLKLGAVEGTLGESLTIEDLSYANNSIGIQIDRLNLSAPLGSLLRGTLLIGQIDVQGIRATPNPDAPDKPPTPLRVPELAAPLPVVVQRLHVTDAVWTPLPDTPLQRLETRLEWTGTVITMADLTFATPIVQGAGAANIDTRDDIAVTASLDWAYPAQNLNGVLSAQGSLATLNVSHQLDGQYALRSSGNIGLLNRLAPYIDMQHTCPAPCVVNDIQIEQGSLTHNGTLADSSISVEAQITAAPLERSRVRGDLHLVDGALTIRSLDIAGTALDAALSGTINPGGETLFSITGNVSRLDARVLNEAVNGNLSTTFTATGNSARSVRAALENVTGNINGYALSGRGKLQLDGDQLAIDDASLMLGDNTLALSGTASRAALDLKANLLLANLEQMDPRLSGSANARAVIAGSVKNPQVAASGQAAALKVGEMALASSQFRLNIDKTRNVSGRLSTRDVQQGQHALGSLEVQLGGTLDVLGIAATVDNPQLGVQLASTLRRSDAATVLRIESAAIDGKTLGIWSLEDAFEIGMSAGTLTVDPHLWQSGEAFARLTMLQQKQDELIVQAQLEDLPLALASGFLPTDVSIAGTIDAEVDVGRRNGNWRGNVNWEQTDTVLKLRADEGSRRLALPVVSLQVQQAPDNATAALSIQGDFGLAIAANVSITNPESFTESPISGALRANVADLSWITPWLPDVSELAGQLSAQLDIKGSVDTPTVTGSVMFEEGTLSYDAAGLQLEQMTLVARSDNRASVTLEGSANSGGGSLRFDGAMSQPWTEARTLAVGITGKDVQAFNAPEYQIWLTPELTLLASAKGASLGGTVRVPRANIRVRELPPDVVRRSDDFVVDGRQRKESFSLPFNGDLQVALGEQVHVLALGLDADLGGNLRVRVNADQAPRLDGRIFLKKGRYAAYGQKLDIERGNLIYAGPIANPTLDVRAARKIDDAGTQITAGVMVSGPATSPEIAIFTDPTTSQTDALSYLLLGRAAGNTSGAEGEALSNAALAIGMSRSSPLTTRIASGLGLDELSVGGGNVETAELVAGKQLNDRLYIRYSYGVFSNLGAILLRYRLSRRLALEAGSSDIQSIDVLYTIEK